MVDPVERIKAAWADPQKAAAFDRALGALADRVEQLAEAKGSATLALALHIHHGPLKEARLDPDLRFA